MTFAPSPRALVAACLLASVAACSEKHPAPIAPIVATTALPSASVATTPAASNAPEPSDGGVLPASATASTSAALAASASPSTSAGALDSDGGAPSACPEGMAHIGRYCIDRY